MRNKLKLTAIQLDILGELASIKDRPSRNSKNLTNPNFFDEDVRGYWAAPIDFGGSNGSHHSGTATKLAMLGLVDRFKGGKVNFFKSHYKGSCGYRINSAGLAYLVESKP